MTFSLKDWQTDRKWTDFRDLRKFFATQITFTSSNSTKEKGVKYVQS